VLTEIYLFFEVKDTLELTQLHAEQLIQSLQIGGVLADPQYSIGGHAVTDWGREVVALIIGLQYYLNRYSLFYPRAE